MEEPWDELMGPSPDDLKNILRDESQPGEISSSSRSRTTTTRATTSSPPVRVRSSASSVSSSSSSRRKAAPPPSAMFAGSSSGPRAPSPPPPPPPPQEAFEPQQQQVTTSRTSSKSSSYRKAGLQASGSAVSTAPAVSRVRSGGLAFEDEDNDNDDDDSVSVGNFSSDNVSANDAPEAPDAPAGDPDAIRQEALKMLEVAEATDANYTVHRTISGGFTATHRTLGAANTKERRTRSALSGLSFSSRRASSGSGSTSKYPRYRDDIYQDDEDGGAAVISPSSTQEDYEYGDTSGGVVDVAGMERRSLASRPADPPSTVTRSTAASSSSSSRAGGKNWSSRYSVDNTLLAMAGGSKKAASRNNNNKSVLDRMDRNHERTSRNLFGGGRSGGGGGAPKVFGNGFSFRKDHVFGKQKVTIKQPQQNLQTVWMDVDGSNTNNGSSLPPANPRSKSWQEQLQVKRNQRRTYILAVLVAFCATVTIASIFGTRALGNKDKSTAAAGSKNASDQVNAIPDGSVTFYVTADAPYDLASEEQLQKDLQSLSPTASMLIHLGNLQKADVTLCQSSRYANVAALLRQSPITTFVLPGQEDVNNCPNPAAAFDSWVDSFRFFHRHFQMQSSSLHIMSEADQYENFAVLHQGVLFLGLHLVGGRVPAGGDDDFEDRNEYNYQWVQGMTDKFEEEIRAVVILANARPGEPMNKGLFSDLQEYWSDFDKPVAYVHANSGRTAVGTQLYAPFEGLDHVYGIQVGNSGENPPLRLNVGFGKRPFIVG